MFARWEDACARARSIILGRPVVDRLTDRGTGAPEVIAQEIDGFAFVPFGGLYGMPQVLRGCAHGKGRS
jgi:hypothetical protein